MNRRRILAILTTLFLMNNRALSSSNGYSKEYQNGTVYIGNREYLDNIADIGVNDILVLDARDEKDPDMKVLSSYLVNDPNIQKEILMILKEYEENDPSLWNRSIESMQREWYVHNLMVNLAYETQRTMDVDFNNNDEELYNKEYWKKKILK